MTFSGFDLYADPGDDALRDAVSEGFSWVASYLVATSHSDGSWRNYPVLKANGINVLPIWVGAQIVGPGSHDVGAQQGETEGQACVAQLIQKGYPLASGVAFDTENGDPIPDAQMQHLMAWQAAIVAGGYRPMVYGSYLNFDALASLFGPDNVWTFQLRDEPPEPQGIAVQYQQNVPLVLAGKTYQVDRNVSTVADPAAPLAPTVVLPSTSPASPPATQVPTATGPAVTPSPAGPTAERP